MQKCDLMSSAGLKKSNLGIISLYTRIHIAKKLSCELGCVDLYISTGLHIFLTRDDLLLPIYICQSTGVNLLWGFAMNCLVETYDQIWSGKKKLNTVYVCVNFKISLGIFLSSLIKKKSLITYLLLIKWIKELAN